MSKEWPIWICDYKYEGRSCTIHVQAPSEEEALARLKAAADTATVLGELVEEGYTDAPGAPAMPLLN